MVFDSELRDDSFSSDRHCGRQEFLPVEVSCARLSLHRFQVTRQRRVNSINAGSSLLYPAYAKG